MRLEDEDVAAQPEVQSQKGRIRLNVRSQSKKDHEE